MNSAANHLITLLVVMSLVGIAIGVIRSVQESDALWLACSLASSGAGAFVVWVGRKLLAKQCAYPTR